MKRPGSWQRADGSGQNKITNTSKLQMIKLCINGAAEAKIAQHVPTSTASHLFVYYVYRIVYISAIPGLAILH
jgi:hypothetical protein